MKASLPVKSAILPLFLIAVGLFLGACRGVTAPGGERQEAVRIALLESDEDASAEVEQDTAELSGLSLYLLDAGWSDQNGHRVKLASLQGEPVVLAMVFTHCGSACPLIVHDMKEIAARLPEQDRPNVRFVLVSLDPERDTPDVLGHFAQAHRLDPARWMLLSGKSADVRALAAALGVRYREESDGQIMHANIISILNEKGEIVHQQEGLGSDPTDVVETVTGLLADRS